MIGGLYRFGRQTAHGRILLAVFAAIMLIQQWRAIHTENVNWDEFALFSRVKETLRTGTLIGAGRPGLVVPILIPFVDGCLDSVEAIVSARQLWLGITTLFLAGLFFVVVVVLKDCPSAWAGAATAVGLVALVPVFLRWSLHVRTDQPALMFACWGLVMLLLSTSHALAALVAGVLLALGFLCSQKAIYVGAIATTLLAFHFAANLSARADAWRRGLLLSGLCGLGFVATVQIFELIIQRFFAQQPITTIAIGLDLRSYYRAIFGYRAYAAMLPSLWPHHLLFAGLIWGSLKTPSHPSVEKSRLATCWALLLLAYIVGFVHPGAFPYFWMTLGVIPAIGFGVAREAILEALPNIWRRAFVPLASIVFAATAFAYTVNRQDTQRVQRDALTFTEQTFAPDARGFQAEGALLCRTDPDPFPTLFAENVIAEFFGPHGDARSAAFIDEFRKRPVTFVIAHRLFRFPPAVEEFWRTHYIHHRDEVLIPGREISGSRGEAIDLDIIVPGEYRWEDESNGESTLAIDGHTVDQGGMIPLSVGPHEARLLRDVPAGTLSLNVNAPRRARGSAFYDLKVVQEIDPRFVEFPP